MMIIETWIAALLFILIAVLCSIGLIGWMLAEQRLEESHKENRLLQDKILNLEGKLIVKTANEFYNEGKKK